MSPVQNFWFVAAVVLWVALVFFLMSRIGRSKKKDSPSMMFGVRTSMTTKSAEHWREGHRAASRVNLLGSAIQALNLVMMLMLLPAVGAELAQHIGFAAMMATLIIFSILAAVVAHRAAAELDPQ